MKILVTGTAGFIGMHLAIALLQRGDEVVGLDNINDYYDVNLKFARLNETGILKGDVDYGTMALSGKYEKYRFIQLNLEDRENMEKLFKEEKLDAVCNLAAQAGVRYSLTNPYAYINSNIVGFLNILECSRHNNIKHLVYASSSSVYGLNESQPFSASDCVNHPVSLYAASKKSNELMAHSYSHLYNLPTTGLRFFTVYGPWGRPDMAPYLFTKAISEGNAIDVFNNGEMERDFTYIDDIVQGVVRVIDKLPQGNPDWIGKIGSEPQSGFKGSEHDLRNRGAEPDPATSKCPYRIYNIGNNKPVKLMDFIGTIEKKLGKIAEKNYLPMQPGDVLSTFADIDTLVEDMGYKPDTSIEDGIGKFVDWYLGYVGWR